MILNLIKPDCYIFINNKLNMDQLRIINTIRLKFKTMNECFAFYILYVIAYCLYE